MMASGGKGEKMRLSVASLFKYSWAGMAVLS